MPSAALLDDDGIISVGKWGRNGHTALFHESDSPNSLPIFLAIRLVAAPISLVLFTVLSAADARDSFKS